MRRVDSLTSSSSPVADRVVATHSSPGSSLASPSASATRAHQSTSAPARGERRRQHPVLRHVALGQPVRQGVLAVRESHGIPRRPRFELLTQRVEPGELIGGDRSRREPSEGRQHARIRLPEGVDRPRGRRSGVVELVGEPGGQGAEGGEGLLLPGHRLVVPGGPGHALDEVQAEGEPRGPQPAQVRGGHPEDPPGRRRPAGGEVGPVLVPGAEPAGPPSRHVHGSQPGLVAPDVTDEVDAPVEQHPPVLGGMVLLEEHVTALEGDLGARREQVEQLVVVGARRRARSDAGRRVASHHRQVTVDEVDGHGSLSDGRGDPFHGAQPHVARGEDAGDAGLQVNGERPSLHAVGEEASRSCPVTTKPLSSRTTSLPSQCGAR